MFFRGHSMKFISTAIMATLVLATMPLAAMAQPTGGLPVPPEVPDGSTFVLFGPHWGQKATVQGRQVPLPPSGAYGNFQLPDGGWYPVGVTPPGRMARHHRGWALQWQLPCWCQLRHIRPDRSLRVSATVQSPPAVQGAFFILKIYHKYSIRDVVIY